jgi:pimeloyl-ACP methyl ester carboxylesterase
MANEVEMVQNTIDLYSKSVGVGEVILMIHGAMSDHANFNRIQKILGRNFQTITYNRRGYGTESDLPYIEQDYSVIKQAEEAVIVLKQYTDSPAFIIGDSTGGNIAIQAAILFPHLIKGVFLVETTIPSKGLDLACLNAWQKGVRQIAKSKNIYKVTSLFSEIIGTKPVAQKSNFQNFKKSIYNIRNYLYGEMNDVLDSSFSYDEISRICCPVIMGISMEGKNMPFGIGAKMTADFFGWEKVYLQGHHNTIQEYPYEFSFQIERFINHICNM